MSLIEAALAKFDVKLADKMQVVLKPFSRDHIYVTVQAPTLTEVLEQGQGEEAKALPMPDLPAEAGDHRASPLSETLGLKLVLPERMGVVKAWDFEGTRLHVEFAFLNDSDRLVAISNLIMTIASHPAGFKQFVDVTPDARVPSLDHRLPIVVPARSGIWLCAEMESLVDVKLGSHDENCSLMVGANDEYLTAKFAARGNPVVAEVLEHIKKTATDLQGAAAYGLSITPLP